MFIATPEHRIDPPMSVRPPDCEVIVDRHHSDRRRSPTTWQGEDWRRNDRRSDRLERPDGRVLFVH